MLSPLANMMVSPTNVQIANAPTLKRTFTAIAKSPPELSGSNSSSTDQVPISKARYRGEGVRSHHSTFRQRDVHEVLKMPSAAGTRMYEKHMPSFMSVYGMESSVMESQAATFPHTKVSGTTSNNQPPQHQPQLSSDNENASGQIHLHQHRESTSTQNSDSTDSSPTTTISTVDSSSMSDPSPSSSPSSPVTNTVVPLSSLTGSTFGLDPFQGLKMADTTPRATPLNDDRPMTSPGPRKSKNPKSLALNLRQVFDSPPSSEVSSPSFIKPPTPAARKKPSLLSLNTGAANAKMDPPGSARMPSMLQRRGLKHSVSSPQMLITPGFGPKGGMTLGGKANSKLKESDTFNTINEDTDHDTTGVQMAIRVPGASVGGDSFDRPQTGEDAKSPSYPNGPILMHEPSVHLYMEPKLEEAMKFDVVINVAREVKNPFELMNAEQEKEKERKSEHSKVDSRDIPPDTAASIMSFKTAFEVQPPDTEPLDSSHSSPSTPRPNAKVPEYIHVPWDHNTDVKDELWDLCQLIESRVKEGKRVLVHCQQGASRSATLIIAYGMYTNQSLGPNEAYSLAQSKSRWVNPNMSLLFSLNDFKKIIERKKGEKGIVRKDSKQVKQHRVTLSADSIDQPSTPSRNRGNSTPYSTARENPLGRKAEIKPEKKSETEMDRLSKFDFGFNTTSIPLRQQPEEDDWASGLMSPRLSEMTQNPLQRSFNLIPTNNGNNTKAEEPTDPLFSLRTFEFPRSYFFPPPTKPQSSLLLDEDPRSPPMKGGEAPITRSIDDFI